MSTRPRPCRRAPSTTAIVLRLAERRAEPGVRLDAGGIIGRERDQVLPVAVAELGEHGGGRPRVILKDVRLDRHDRVEVVGGRGPELPGHEVTRFGPAESVTSGERR
jgi:hypothetical protein